jgi:serine/threonine protein phosphatase PrpC
MQPGDMVLLTTDGFFEWENWAQEQFGTKRLGEILRTFCDCQPQVIIAELYDSVVKFSQGTPQKDDLTAVLIKREAVEDSRRYPRDSSLRCAPVRAVDSTATFSSTALLSA